MDGTNAKHARACWFEGPPGARCEEWHTWRRCPRPVRSRRCTPGKANRHEWGARSPVCSVCARRECTCVQCTCQNKNVRELHLRPQNAWRPAYQTYRNELRIYELKWVAQVITCTCACTCKSKPVTGACGLASVGESVTLRFFGSGVSCNTTP